MIASLKSAIVAAVAAIALAAATIALAGSGVGGIFQLGVDNTVNHTTTLRNTGAITGPQLQVKNTAGGAALDLQVNAGKPPMTVNSAALVPKLNADLLDGNHAAHLLAVTGKAANSSALGGYPPGSYVQGSGFAVNRTKDLAPNAFPEIVVAGAYEVDYACPSDPGTNGQVSLYKGGSSTAEVFADRGGSDPDYTSLAAGQSFTVPASPGGEEIVFQAGSTDGEVATFWVLSHQGASGCHVQVQGLYTP